MTLRTAAARSDGCLSPRRGRGVGSRARSGPGRRRAPQPVVDRASKPRLGHRRDSDPPRPDRPAYPPRARHRKGKPPRLDRSPSAESVRRAPCDGPNPIQTSPGSGCVAPNRTERPRCVVRGKLPRRADRPRLGTPSASAKSSLDRLGRQSAGAQQHCGRAGSATKPDDRRFHPDRAGPAVQNRRDAPVQSLQHMRGPRRADPTRGVGRWCGNRAAKGRQHRLCHRMRRNPHRRPSAAPPSPGPTTPPPREPAAPASAAPARTPRPAVRRAGRTRASRRAAARSGTCTISGLKRGRPLAAKDARPPPGQTVHPRPARRPSRSETRRAAPRASSAAARAVPCGRGQNAFGRFHGMTQR